MGTNIAANIAREAVGPAGPAGLVRYRRKQDEGSGLGTALWQQVRRVQQASPGTAVTRCGKLREDNPDGGEDLGRELGVGGCRTTTLAQGRVLGSTAGLGRCSGYGSKEGAGSCRYSRSQQAQPASPGAA